MNYQLAYESATIPPKVGACYHHARTDAVYRVESIINRALKIDQVWNQEPRVVYRNVDLRFNESYERFLSQFLNEFTLIERTEVHAEPVADGNR